MNTRILPCLAQVKSVLLVGGVALLAVSPVHAQTTYTVVDLSTAASPYGAAYAASGGEAAGVASPSPESSFGVANVPTLMFPHAALWNDDGLTDLHPAALLGGDATNSFSTVLGFAGDVQIGWGRGPATQGVSVPLVWRDTAASARALALPAATSGALATATDGTQIVGEALVANRYHALLWSVTGGAATDLGEGWVYGVARGQQVGYTSQSKGTAATIWKGASKSAIVIHPKTVDTSTASATDGVHQAGFSSVTTKVPGEGGTHGGTTRTMFLPTVWSGTSASAVFLVTYPYQMGFATGVSGSKVVGYVYNGTTFGAPGAYHAVVWNLNDPSAVATDLNASLPAGYTGAMANAIDAQGNVTGTLLTADGVQHPAIWLPNP